MAFNSFHRVDLQIALCTFDPGRAFHRVGAGDTFREYDLPRSVVDYFLEHAHRAFAPHLPSFGIDLSAELARWRASLGEMELKLKSDPLAITVPRITIDVDDPRLTPIRWEHSFGELLTEDEQMFPVLRSSQVVPRIHKIPLTLPVRLLQVGTSSGTQIADIVHSVLGTSANTTHAIDVAGCNRFEEVEEFRRDRHWATAEILHLDFGATEPPPLKQILSIASQQPGTLGWLSRLAETWQTRLVVMECRFEWGMAALRLAAGLVARGGPAVLVRQVSNETADCDAKFFWSFYERLIHDWPLDVAVRDAAGQCGETPRDRTVLFVGRGREDLLRIASIGAALDQLAGDWLAVEKESKTRGPLEEAVSFDPHNDFRRVANTAGFADSLNDFRDAWPGLDFAHERGALLPMADRLNDLRGTSGLDQPKLLGSKFAEDRTPRYVNAALAETFTSPTGFDVPDTRRLDPAQTHVWLGTTYQFGVQIGPQDKQITVIGRDALFEEVFKWSSETPGVWLEVGVTALDFELQGDAVQELWLTQQDQTSEQILFAITPRKAGLSYLRFCVYYQNNVIQSQRMVAWIDEPGKPTATDERRAAFAQSLGMPVEDVPDVSYLLQCEYSVTSDLNTIRELPDRALSIVANDIAGRAVTTIKGADCFEVRSNNSLPKYITLARATLDRIAYQEQFLPHSKIPYFGKPGRPNATDLEKLKEPLRKLAAVGWTLYDQVIPEVQRQELESALAADRSKIHVAHVLLEKVIPWGLLYDRPYDPRKPATEAGYDACLVAVPDENGVVPVQHCGEHPNCPLHDLAAWNLKRAANSEPPLFEETIACPRRFWGFRHIIELPIQQVATGSRFAQQPATTRLAAARPVQVSAGINTGLNLAQRHRQELDALLKRPEVGAVLKSAGDNRTAILENLKDLGLDLIYLYCHTRGGDADQTIFPPHLDFEHDGQAGIIEAADLQYSSQWPHHPLVFLNGCGTAAFSPDALSEFITKFVQGRGASGVVGTEVPVIEELAGEMAIAFLSRFLRGATAGDALLAARLALLAQHNPLGLAYTLYAFADLHIDPEPNGSEISLEVRLVPEGEIDVGGSNIVSGGIRLQRNSAEHGVGTSIGLPSQD